MKVTRLLLTLVIGVILLGACAGPSAPPGPAETPPPTATSPPTEPAKPPEEELTPTPAEEEKPPVTPKGVPEVTEVRGPISKDTTWSGEVLVVDGVDVAKGVTLTIEPGTVVKFKHWRYGYTEPPGRCGIAVYGTLRAIGTPEKPIRFTSDAAQPEHGDWAGINFREPASDQNILDHCIVEYAAGVALDAQHVDFTLSNSIVRWTTGPNLCFSFCSPTIEYNRIYGAGHCNIEFVNAHPTIQYNTIFAAAGHGIVVDTNSQPIIRYNLIKDNGDFGIGIDHVSSAIIEYNTITGNNGWGIGISSGSKASETTVKHNNIYDNNKFDIGIIDEVVGDLTATHNWWGTVDRQQIEAKIHDSRTVPALKTVLYEPYLTAPFDIGTLTYDFESPEIYAHLPGTESDTYLYIFPDDDTRKVVSSWYPEAGNPYGITWDGEHLWVSTSPDHMLRKFDTSGKLLDSFPSPGPNPWGLAFDGRYLWCADRTENLVYQIDQSGKVVKSIPTPAEECMGLTYDGQYLWTCPGHEPRKAYKFDTSGKVVDVLQIPLKGCGLAWDGENLWVTIGAAHKIYAIDPTDGHAIGWISAPGEDTADLAWQGKEYLWAISEVTGQWEDAKVFQMKILHLATVK